MLLFFWAVWLRTSYPTFLNISQMVTTCVGVIVGFLPDGMLINLYFFGPTEKTFENAFCFSSNLVLIRLPLYRSSRLHYINVDYYCSEDVQK